MTPLPVVVAGEVDVLVLLGVTGADTEPLVTVDGAGAAARVVGDGERLAVATALGRLSVGTRTLATSAQARGYTVESDLHLFAKRAWALPREWGTVELHTGQVVGAIGLYGQQVGRDEQVQLGRCE